MVSKLITLPFGLLLLTGVSSAQQKPKDRFMLQGTVVNQQSGWVYLLYNNKDGNHVRDSAALKNGAFRFTGFVSGPTMATLYGKVKSMMMDDPNLTSFYLEPAVMNITLRENAFKKAKITGSKTQREYEAFQNPVLKLRERWQVVFDTLAAVNSRSNEQFQKLKSWVLRPYEAEVTELARAFLASHPTSYVAPQALLSLAGELSTDSLAMYYNHFPAGVKNTAYGKYIGEELERRKIGVPGTVAANFTATDITGNKLSLSDYRGKYVLLDFWASWCVPCRAGNPHLKQLYAKYKDKGFEIIGVSDDDGKPDAWKNAVEKDGIGVWKHVLRGYDMNKRMKGEKNPADISEHYGIATLPTKILINPDGTIIGRYGEGKEDDAAMDAKLAAIFNP